MTRISESQWVAYYGLQRFPFDRPEAGNEEFARPDFLAASFVEPICFERILGQSDAPVTSLLFAARGSGKTACRVMVDYYCKQGLLPPQTKSGLELPNFVLSVPHIHHHRPVEIARAGNPSEQSVQIRAEHHVVEILCRAVLALVELVASQPALQTAVSDLPNTISQTLRWLIWHYRNNLQPIQTKFLSQQELWLTQVPDDSLFQSWSQLSPLDHLAQLTEIVTQVGIRATYVLVDGVDELTETAGDAEAAYGIIRPLLTTLRLMDSTPYLAFKFFLPAQVEPFLYQDAAFRRDRGFIIEHLQWSDTHLIDILRRRLDALKVDKQDDRIITSFDAVCVPELRGRIEPMLVEQVQGNPRYLMLLCGLIVTAHCAADIKDQGDPYQLSQQAVTTAMSQFSNRITGWSPPVPIDSSAALLSCIVQGEHEQLEFKSSVQWNIRTNSTDKSLRLNIARAMAGMMNRHGGQLLIGVADDGRILGIENDLITTKGSLDKFRLLLEEIVKTYLGAENAAHKQIAFQTVEEKTVCIVHIRPAPEAVFVYYNNAHTLYVRFGNRTDQLDTKTAVAYIKTHRSK